MQDLFLHSWSRLPRHRSVIMKTNILICVRYSGSKNHLVIIASRPRPSANRQSRVNFPSFPFLVARTNVQDVQLYVLRPRPSVRPVMHTTVTVGERASERGEEAREGWGGRIETSMYSWFGVWTERRDATRRSGRRRRDISRTLARSLARSPAKLPPP